MHRLVTAAREPGFAARMIRSDDRNPQRLGSSAVVESFLMPLLPPRVVVLSERDVLLCTPKSLKFCTSFDSTRNKRGYSL